MITNAQKQTLADYFTDQPVDAVYLFGSQTTGKANALSYVDIAVLFPDTLTDKERFDMRLSMMNDAGIITGYPDRTDVIDLQAVPLVLQYGAIANRQELMVKNRERQAVFEADVLSKYFDYIYFLKTNTRVGLVSMAK